MRNIFNKSCISLVLLSAPALADDALDEIVVTATRMPETALEISRSVSVVTRDQIQAATQQLSIDEALGTVPGLYVQNRYNFSQDLRLSLRGFGARSSFGIRGIRIYVDGIPESLPDGQAQVDNIDIGTAQQIEVIRGPSSALYGNASGGVISISSELGSDADYVDGRLAVGSYDFRQLQFKALGETDGYDYLFSASHTELDGYRDHSRFEGSRVTARLATDPVENGFLNISYNYNDQPVAQDPGGINADQAASAPSSARDRNVQFNAGEKLSQHRLGLRYQHELDAGELSFRNYYVWRDFANRLPFTGGGAVDIERFFYGGGVQFSSASGDRLDYIVGFDLDRQDDRRRRFDNNDGTIGALAFDQDEVVTSAGIYAQGNVELAPRWSLTAGLRFDDVNFDVSDRFLANGDDSGDISFDELSTTLSVGYATRNGLVFAAYSSGFETPTTTELANPDGSGGFNPLLDAQTSQNFEVGFKTSIEQHFFEVVIFHIDVDDELIPFELPAFPGRTFYENAGSSSRDGIEVAWSWRGDNGFGTDFAYTWSDFRFDDFVDDGGNDFSGNRMPGLPQHFGYASVSYNNEEGLFATLEANYSGSLTANNAATVEVDRYIVGNLRFGYRYSDGRWRFEPFFGINNLLDESYNTNIRINAFGGRYFEPAPERNYYAGFSLRFE